jgi:hypothetical protein
MNLLALSVLLFGKALSSQFFGNDRTFISWDVEISIGTRPAVAQKA